MALRIMNVVRERDQFFRIREGIPVPAMGQHRREINRPQHGGIGFRYTANRNNVEGWSGRLREHEKTAWMLRSLLEQEGVR